MTNKARDFAIKWHGDQRYGDKPYVYHLDQVADNVCATGDGSWEPDAVFAHSKTEGEPYDHYMWRVKQNEIARAVEIADTKANLKQSILDNDKNRIVKYAKQLMLLEE